MSTLPTLLGAALASVLWIHLPAQADSELPNGTTAGSSNRSLEDMDLGDIAKMTSNPLSIAWMIWFQNDLTRVKGEDLPQARYSNSTTFQPVMAFPFALGDDEWTLAVRPALQYHSAPFNSSAARLLGKSVTETMSDPQLLRAAMAPYDGRTNGMGDTALITMVGPNREDGVIWGFGVTQLFPTAENDLLGQGKWQAGPSAFAGRLAPEPGGWITVHWCNTGGRMLATSRAKTPARRISSTC